jgi:serine/threonine protein kinase
MPAQANQPLPEGFTLENYRILRVLASGGFSFVYLAHDENEVPVAIKEYLPAALALRSGASASPSVPEESRAMFLYGMKCFFEEGKALAGLSHPNIVRVLNFFRANDTVYLVMRYERGRSLLEHIHKRHGALKEDWLRDTFTQLLNGLREVHSSNFLHLDIKPANVYLRNDGAPLLIDFGAARETLSEGEGARLPPMFTPGFAAPEHHRSRRKLGPWSDIYSIGATLYACLAGETPQSAPERLEKDRLTPARRAWAGKYSDELLDTIDWCLRLNHLERPQSVLALQKSLRGDAPPGYSSAVPTPFLEQVKDAVLRLAKGGKRL